MSKPSPRMKPGQLLRLSDQVRRLAESVAELATGEESAEADQSKEDGIDVSQGVVTGVMQARRARARYVGVDLFSDPVWDILLFLLHAEIEGRPVRSSDASDASGVPDTVARRWIETMVEYGLVALNDHPAAKGDERVVLTRNTSANMRRYFRDLVERG